MLPDYLRPGLLAVFVGTSVSTISVGRGHYYSNPTNKFWELLTATGLTSGQRLRPEDDIRVNDFGVGLTDVVKARAESSDARLKPGDFDVPNLLGKVASNEPTVVAFNGERATAVVARHLKQDVPGGVGPASWTIASSLVYRLPSSSAAASIGTEAKTKAWREFGEWLRSTRSGSAAS